MSGREWFHSNGESYYGQLGPAPQPFHLISCYRLRHQNTEYAHARPATARCACSSSKWGALERSWALGTTLGRSGFSCYNATSLLPASRRGGHSDSDIRYSYSLYRAYCRRTPFLTRYVNNLVKYRKVKGGEQTLFLSRKIITIMQVQEEHIHVTCDM